MFRRMTLAAAVALLAPLAAFAAPKEEPKPQVEVVFCLDTTGSMSNLIEGAKQKIWAISNQIASGKPTPQIKIGLVAYRDKNDAYVTQVHDLTDDLDAVHANLKTFTAGGGGDTPEHVNQALHDAVHKIKWSEDKKTLRIVFLVGDAPPHMDYTDDVKYTETCKKANEKGIIVNTVHCGDNAECATVWKDICTKAEGTYVKLDHTVQVVRQIDTPFDKELTEANRELAKSTLTFGNRARKAEDDKKKEAAQALPPGAAPERAAYQAKTGQAATYDLLDQIKGGKVKLADVKEDELPEEIKKLKPEERQEYLKKLETRRAELNKKILELDKKRSDYIAKEQAKDQEKGKNAFDDQVLNILRKQAKKHKIDY